MKQATTLFVAITVSLFAFSQQTTTSTQAVADSSVEKTNSYLSMIGGLSAAYLISTQDHIDAMVLLHGNKLKTTEETKQKLTAYKNIAAIMIKQINRMKTTNALVSGTPDYAYVTDLEEVINAVSDETVRFMAYLQDPARKTEFETLRESTKKKIRVLLGMDN